MTLEGSRGIAQSQFNVIPTRPNNKKKKGVQLNLLKKKPPMEKYNSGPGGL